jgi:uncharacterized iron-regulated membrane protein
MKKETLKNLTFSHGWIGIIISGLLFLIFLAGSISLFRAEIYQWSVEPSQGVQQGTTLSPSEIMQIAIKGRQFDAKEHLAVLPPDDSSPYYRVYVDLLEPHKGEHFIGLLMEPTTGKVIGEIDQFFLAEFIYSLHESGNLPGQYGRYIFGVVTLFFFFMLMSGVFIHAKKLFNNFFQYRADSNRRSQWLDMHNVIGTISLPFTVMYAMTGLIFNIIIVYQIAFAVVLYKGDQQALLADAGFHTIQPEWQDQPAEFNNIDSQVSVFTEEFGYVPRVIRMYNYGDKSAVLHLIGEIKGAFPQRYEVAIKLEDESILFKNDSADHSEVRHGTDVMAELHFGSFAGLDLRFIYFILGLGVCGLIVTGNLLWIEKRQKNRKESKRAVNVMTKLTLATTIGMILACSAAFLTESLMPMDMENRAQVLIYAFLAVLGLASIASTILNKQLVVVGGLWLSCATLIGTIGANWLLYGENLKALWQHGTLLVFGVQFGIFLVAMLLAICAASVQHKKPFVQKNAPLPVDELPAEA